jgi:hypothetical protein
VTGLLADVAAEVRPFRAEVTAFAYVLTVAALFDLLTWIGAK